MTMLREHPMTCGDIVYLHTVMVNYRDQLMADIKLVGAARIKWDIESELRVIEADIKLLTNLPILSPFGMYNGDLELLWRKWAHPTHMNR